MLHINKLSFLTIAFAVLFISGLQAQTKSEKDSTMQHHKTQKMMEKKMDQKADHGMDHTGHMMMKSDTSKMMTVKIFNKFCPVRGEEVDPEAPAVEYKGKTYGFCCPGCDKKFEADPEKYLGNLSKDGQKFVGTTK